MSHCTYCRNKNHKDALDILVTTTENKKVSFLSTLQFRFSRLFTSSRVEFMKSLAFV